MITGGWAQAVNAITGIVLIGVYIASAVRLWQRRGKWWAILPSVTALIYALPTATYVLGIIHGTARTTVNVLGLLLLIFPAFLVLQALRATLQDEAMAKRIVKELSE